MQRVGTGVAAPSEMPCIRCGDCAAVCPVQLQPQQLLADLRGGQVAQAELHQLADCSECGRCDQACPSHIRLSQRFAGAKVAALEGQQRLRVADAARERHQERGRRLQRESLERAQRDSDLVQDAASTDAVAAAIARATARRLQPRERP